MLDQRLDGLLGSHARDTPLRSESLQKPAKIGDAGFVIITIDLEAICVT